VRGMGDEGDEGAHPGEIHPRLKEIRGDRGESPQIATPQRPSAAFTWVGSPQMVTGRSFVPGILSFPTRTRAPVRSRISRIWVPPAQIRQGGHRGRDARSVVEIERD
jgi:hypothetical protein